MAGQHFFLAFMMHVSPFLVARMLLRVLEVHGVELQYSKLSFPEYNFAKVTQLSFDFKVYFVPRHTCVEMPAIRAPDTAPQQNNTHRSTAIVRQLVIML